MKTSNKFTMVRIVAAPIIFIAFFLPIWIFGEDAYTGELLSKILICCIIPFLGFAELTDGLDGHFARKHNEVSDFGKMLDPFADVFLHMSLFTCFVMSKWMHPALYMLLFFREFGQSFLRMVAAKQGTAIAARKGGKLKTVFYVASCFVALVAELLVRFNSNGAINPDPENLRRTMFWIATGFFTMDVILSYVSFIDYLRNFGKVLKDAAK